MVLPSQTPHSSRSPLHIKGLRLASESLCDVTLCSLCHQYLQSKPALCINIRGAHDSIGAAEAGISSVGVPAGASCRLQSSAMWQILRALASNPDPNMRSTWSSRSRRRPGPWTHSRCLAHPRSSQGRRSRRTRPARRSRSTPPAYPAWHPAKAVCMVWGVSPKPEIYGPCSAIAVAARVQHPACAAPRPPIQRGTLRKQCTCMHLHPCTVQVLGGRLLALHAGKQR